MPTPQRQPALRTRTVRRKLAQDTRALLAFYRDSVNDADDPEQSTMLLTAIQSLGLLVNLERISPDAAMSALARGIHPVDESEPVQVERVS
jgi:hypothetical protein